MSYVYGGILGPLGTILPRPSGHPKSISGDPPPSGVPIWNQNPAKIDLEAFQKAIIRSILGLEWVYNCSICWLFKVFGPLSCPP